MTDDDVRSVAHGRAASAEPSAMERCIGHAHRNLVNETLGRPWEPPEEPEDPALRRRGRRLLGLLLLTVVTVLAEVRAV
jgi:hypothetical protein